MFKQLAKPNKRKEGRKFISTLSDFDVESDSVFATPKQSTSKDSPYQEYFSDAVLNRENHTRSSKIGNQIDELCDQTKLHAKTLSYFKSKIRIDMNKVPSQSTLITAASLSNRNLRSTPYSQFSSLQSQQKLEKVQVKDFLPQNTQTRNSIQSEEAHDIETEAGDHVEDYNQLMGTDQFSIIKQRLSSPKIQFESSEQVLITYFGNVSRKQQQISKLIEIKQQTTKDKIRAQMQKISDAQEKLSQLASSNSIASLNNSPLVGQQSELIQKLYQKKQKSNSDLIPQFKQHSENSIQNDRSFSVLEHNVSTPTDFQNGGKKNKKKSLYDIKLPQKSQQQLQIAQQQNDPTPIALKIQNLFHSDTPERSSFSSVTSLSQKCQTTQKKATPIKSIFQRDAQTEPYSINRKGKSVHSLIEDESSLSKQTINHTESKGFLSQRGSHAFEKISKMKFGIKKNIKRQASPFHRSQQIFEKTQSKLNTPFGVISQKITFNIISLKRYFKNDARVFRYLSKILSKRHECLNHIFIKSEKKQEIFDNVVAIESNIQASVNQFEMQKKSHIMKLKQKYTEAIVFIEPQQLMKELQYFFDDLEQLCLHKMKEKVCKAFEAVAFNDQRVEENLQIMQKQYKPIPLEFQKRKYLYMNENILYIPEKLQFYEKSLGEFNLISHEARLLQKEIEKNICQLKQIDRDQRNPYRKQVIDSTQK